MPACRKRADVRHRSALPTPTDLEIEEVTTGKIVEYDKEDGGYIQPDDGSNKIPFLQEDLKASFREHLFKEGDRVQYDVEGGLAGLKAKDISLIDRP